MTVEELKNQLIIFNKSVEDFIEIYQNKLNIDIEIDVITDPETKRIISVGFKMKL